MTDDRIRQDQDDLEIDESISDNDGGVAEMPEAADEDDDDLDDLDEDD